MLINLIGMLFLSIRLLVKNLHVNLKIKFFGLQWLRISILVKILNESLKKI